MAPDPAWPNLEIGSGHFGELELGLGTGAVVTAEWSGLVLSTLDSSAGQLHEGW